MVLVKHFILSDSCRWPLIQAAPVQTWTSQRTLLIPIRMCGSMSQVVGLPNNSYQHIINMALIRALLCKLQKGELDSQPQVDNIYQLLAIARWFSPSTLDSSTTKTGHHELAKILLKVALNTNNLPKSTDQNDALSALFRPLSVVLDITG